MAMFKKIIIVTGNHRAIDGILDHIEIFKKIFEDCGVGVELSVYPKPDERNLIFDEFTDYNFNNILVKNKTVATKYYLVATEFIQKKKFSYTFNNFNTNVITEFFLLIHTLFYKNIIEKDVFSSNENKSYTFKEFVRELFSSKRFKVKIERFRAIQLHDTLNIFRYWILDLFVGKDEPVAGKKNISFYIKVALRFLFKPVINLVAFFIRIFDTLISTLLKPLVNLLGFLLKPVFNLVSFPYSYNSFDNHISILLKPLVNLLGFLLKNVFNLVNYFYIFRSWIFRLFIKKDKVEVWKKNISSFTKINSIFLLKPVFNLFSFSYNSFDNHISILLKPLVNLLGFLLKPVLNLVNYLFDFDNFMSVLLQPLVNLLGFLLKPVFNFVSFSYSSFDTFISTLMQPLVNLLGFLLIPVFNFFYFLIYFMDNFFSTLFRPLFFLLEIILGPIVMKFYTYLSSLIRAFYDNIRFLTMVTNLKYFDQIFCLHPILQRQYVNFCTSNSLIIPVFLFNMPTIDAGKFKEKIMKKKYKFYVSGTNTKHRVFMLQKLRNIVTSYFSNDNDKDKFTNLGNKQITFSHLGFSNPNLIHNDYFFSFHPLQTTDWKFSSPVRIYRCLTVDFSLPIVEKIFNDHRIESLCLQLDYDEIYYQTKEYFINENKLVLFSKKINDYNEYALNYNFKVLEHL